MYETMLKAKSILDDLEIPFWLDCGTLLFMYRDHKPDETDTDFAIYEKDVIKLIGNLDVFLSTGFKLFRIWTHPKKGIIEISLMDGDNKVDIFTKFYKGKNAYAIATFDQVYIVAKYPKRHFESLAPYSLDGMTYWNIPNDVESYLETYYGKDWRIPKPQWNWTKDAPCIDKEFKI